MPGGKRRLTPAKLAVVLLLVGAFTWYALQVLKPSLPILVQFRSELPGSGFELIFKNQSDQALSFTATLTHPGRQDEAKFPIQIQPQGVYELGSSQGWQGQSGDRISLTSANYRIWKGGIP